MAAASMLTTASLSFSPLALARPAAGVAASFAPPRRAAAAASLRAAAAPSKSPAVASPKKRRASGLTKPLPVSPALQAVVGDAVIPRTEALKRLWAYIKQHNLQDPTDKKVIVCDEKLKAIFAGQERVGFLEVARLLNPHFVK